MSFKLKQQQQLLVRIVAALLLLLLLLALVAIFFPQQVLTVDSGPVTADVMIVLGGGAVDRPQRAAELFKAGEAPKIIVSGFGDDFANFWMLKTNGVPAAVIDREGNSKTTYENAKFSLVRVRQMEAQRVIIVTSWFHSRRALATFRKLAPDLKFFSRPAYLGYDAKDRHVIRKHMRLEYPKILIYWLWHGVWSV